MRINARGQVTIPKRVRDATGLLPGTEVEFVVEPGGVRLVRAPRAGGQSRGAMVVALLRGSARPSR